MEFEKSVRIVDLFNIYGCLLTDKKQQYFKEYFEFDLSLSEISSNNNISRAAVFDSIKSSIELLEYYESNLHIYENNQELQGILNSKLLDRDKIEKIKERII